MLLSADELYRSGVENNNLPFSFFNTSSVKSKSSLLSVFTWRFPFLENILLYLSRKWGEDNRLFSLLSRGCGSGNVSQISDTSFSAKNFSINSIRIRKKAALGILFSFAVFAPLHKRAPFISIPIKFLSGYSFAIPIVYSPLPQPNSSTTG